MKIRFVKFLSVGILGILIAACGDPKEEWMSLCQDRHNTYKLCKCVYDKVESVIGPKRLKEQLKAMPLDDKKALFDVRGQFYRACHIQSSYLD